jgi:hypothetical protein
LWYLRVIDKSAYGRKRVRERETYHFVCAPALPPFHLPRVLAFTPRERTGTVAAVTALFE